MGQNVPLDQMYSGIFTSTLKGTFSSPFTCGPTTINNHINSINIEIIITIHALPFPFCICEFSPSCNKRKCYFWHRPSTAVASVLSISRSSRKGDDPRGPRSYRIPNILPRSKHQVCRYLEDAMPTALSPACQKGLARSLVLFPPCLGFQCLLLLLLSSSVTSLIGYP